MNYKKKLTDTKDILEVIRLYTEQQLGSDTIAKMFDVSETTVLRRLKANNIPIRSAYEKRHKPNPNKYKAKHPRGKNPNSHGPSYERVPSPHFVKDLRQYKYKTRIPPIPCIAIARHGGYCKKYAHPGSYYCVHHGGRPRNIKTGSRSVALKRNIVHAFLCSLKKDKQKYDQTHMHFLSQLSPDEIAAVNNNDYSKLKILQTQHKLSDVLLTRAIKYLNESEAALAQVNADIEEHKNGNPGAQHLTSLMITQTNLQKNITSTHTIISKHQETIAKLVAVQDQVIGTGDVKGSLNALTIAVSKDSLQILGDLVKSYMLAGAIDSVEDIKAFLPQEYIPIAYEELDE